MVIQLDNHVINYEHKGEGMPLILLHGNGEDHHIFDPLIEELKGDYDIYAMDSRGHGLSAKEEEYHYSDMADDVIRFIEELEIDKPLICGFSDGGILALIAAIRRSDLLSGIIVCGANLTPKALTLGAKLEIKKEYRKNRDPLAYMMLNEPDIRPEELRNIKVPALIMAGEKDMIKLSHTKLIASSIPDCKMEIVKGADHGSYVIGETTLAAYIRRL